MVVLLHHAPLIFGRQERQHRGRLKVPAPDPLFLWIEPSVAAIPVRKCLSRVNRWTAGLLRLGQQRIVMFFSSFVRIWTHNLGDFPVEIAITPRAKSLVSDHIGESARRIAPEIALVQPVLAIKVEIFAAEQVDWKRCDTWWRARRPVLLRIRASASSATSSSALLGYCGAERHRRDQQN